jgi:hypothetical protein
LSICAGSNPSQSPTLANDDLGDIFATPPNAFNRYYMPRVAARTNTPVELIN